jgi:chromate transporter
VLLLAVAYTFFGHHPEVIAALRGMGAVAAGLITATGIKLLSALKTNVLGPVLCIILGVASFVGTALFQWRMTYILFGLGGIACVIAYLKIKDAVVKDKQ